MFQKTTKVMENVAGSGTKSYRVTIPIEFVKLLDLKKGEKMDIVYVKNKIILKKIKELK